MLCWPDRSQTWCSTANRCCAGVPGEEASGHLCRAWADMVWCFSIARAVPYARYPLHTTHRSPQLCTNETVLIKQTFDLFWLSDSGRGNSARNELLDGHPEQGHELLLGCLQAELWTNAKGQRTCGGHLRKGCRQSCIASGSRQQC